jgi:alkanesulfonate monooxygenase SsuD/methylene tetrahydromethanopterin reductase-like flavin-dependent oxidoreductase (luciferase family)
VSLTSSYVVADPSQGARYMIERAQAADRGELDSLTVGDHHAMSASYYQNTPILGRLLSEWGPRPAGCLFLLPLWNPVLVAEHIGTLASLTEAPFIVQTGIGSGDSQFAAMNADPRTRGATLEASVAFIRELLSGAEVESDLVGAPVKLGLVPRQAVEWWIGGGPAPRAIERAAKMGDAWYLSPRTDPAAAMEQMAVYVQACEHEGKTPRPILRKDVVIMREPGRAAALAAPILAAGYRGMDEHQLIIGTPAEAAHQLQPFVELGITEFSARCMSVEQPHAIETIECLAEVRELLSSAG